MPLLLPPHAIRKGRAPFVPPGIQIVQERIDVRGLHIRIGRNLIRGIEIW